MPKQTVLILDASIAEASEVCMSCVQNWTQQLNFGCWDTNFQHVNCYSNMLFFVDLFPFLAVYSLGRSTLGQLLYTYDLILSNCPSVQQCKGVKTPRKWAEEVIGKRRSSIIWSFVSYKNVSGFCRETVKSGSSESPLGAVSTHVTGKCSRAPCGQ